MGVFSLPNNLKDLDFVNQSHRSSSVLEDGSTSLGLFRREKNHCMAELNKTDLLICSNFGGMNYSLITG